MRSLALTAPGVPRFVDLLLQRIAFIDEAGAARIVVTEIARSLFAFGAQSFDRTAVFGRALAYAFEFRHDVSSPGLATFEFCFQPRQFVALLVAATGDVVIARGEFLFPGFLRVQVFARLFEPAAQFVGGTGVAFDLGVEGGNFAFAGKDAVLTGFAAAYAVYRQARRIERA